MINEELLKEVREEARKVIHEESNQLFQDALFMQKAEAKVIKMMQEEIRVLIANSDLHSLVGRLVRDKLKDANFQEIVEKVIYTYVQSLNKKLSKEHEIIKQLSYSVDAEIKHALMRAGTSIDTDKEIKKLIKERLNKICDDTLKIENNSVKIE